MSDPPQLTFNQEELTLTISNLGGGWSFGNLGHLSLFDQAEVQFPSSWSSFQIGVAMQVVDMQWRLNSRLLLEQTLEGGVEFTRADGVGSSMTLDNDLKYHLLDRPTTSIDLRLNIRLEGRYESGAYEGSGTITLGVGGRF